MFTKKDLQQVQAKGISLAVIDQQITNFKNGFPFMDIRKAATVGKGILQIEKATTKQYVTAFEQFSKDKQLLKFVPASGAASRMFKQLFAFIEGYDGTKEEKWKNALNVAERIEEFAFFDDLEKKFAEQSKTIKSLQNSGETTTLLEGILSEQGLNYGNLPKGLLKFHNYETGARTSFEEHLIEGAKYCKNEAGIAYLHFTVSPEHQPVFEALLQKVKAHYEKELDCQFEIAFSQQAPYTDTMAVEMDNQPFRLADGRILFRPGGHGALIENLNALDADVVFIKNIDNVVPDRLKETTITYKKLIAGVLVDFQAKIFDYLEKLGTVGEGTAKNLIAEIVDFCNNELCLLLPEAFIALEEQAQVQYLFDQLNRPIRVCGMVKNEGEPGGGPYWTKNSDETTSLQIVESAQINKADETQHNIMQAASHFNPVDLVCGMKDYRGEKFDLLQFRDPETGFIAYKSKNGRELKAQELPGLWNGAMAKWTTIFVEVPIETFNPVKTVNDLLRPQHQS